MHEKNGLFVVWEDSAEEVKKMSMKKWFISLFLHYGQKYAGQPSIRGCYEPKVPESLKTKKEASTTVFSMSKK